MRLSVQLYAAFGCAAHTPLAHGLVGSHGVADLVSAAAAAVQSRGTSQVAILYDSAHGGPILQLMQDALSSIGVSSITFNTDSADSSVTGDLAVKLRKLMKKRLFNSIVMATPHNAVTIAAAASNASVMQQNYFWLIIDSGLSKAQLMSVCPVKCNLALLRGGTTGVNEPARCTTAQRDVFQECHTDYIRTLDVRLVDSMEALAVALTNSIKQATFQASNASCFPLQSWSSGAHVLNNLLSVSVCCLAVRRCLSCSSMLCQSLHSLCTHLIVELSSHLSIVPISFQLNNYESDRGVISYNSTSGFFNAQGVEIVASLSEHESSAVRFVLSARFSSNTLMKLFKKLGTPGLVFPNTFTGFDNATIVACAPFAHPATIIVQELGNNTFIGSGLVPELLDFLSQKMNFRYIIKTPDDGQWGGPTAGSEFFTGCVGEVQRRTADIGAGPFTKSTVREPVIDFSAGLFSDSYGIMVPRPAAASKMWNVFLPLHWQVWAALAASFFVAAFAVWILAFFSPFSAINLALDGATDDEASFPEYMWTIVGSFLQQGQDFYPLAMSPRIVLAFWWFFNVIFYAAYTAFLTSTLTVTLTNLPIKTLLDLASQTEIRPGVTVGTNLYTLLTSAKSGIYKQLGDMLVTVGKCRNEIFSGRQVACIGDYSLISYAANVNCSQVYTIEETFDAATVAFVLPEDAAYADLINYHIQKLREAGQMQRWQQQYFFPDSDVQCSVGMSYSGAESIGLDTVAGCFIVTGGFYAAGFLLLAGGVVLSKLCGLRRCRGCCLN